MNAKELRLGNLIIDKNGVVVSVSVINCDDTIRINENGEIHG